MPQLSEFENTKPAVVLDLGSGTGMVGIVAALLGAKRVILSDIEDLVPLMNKNVLTNAALLGRAAMARVTIMCLPWGSQSSMPTKADIIFASDCLYDDTFFADLVETLVANTHSRSVIYFAYQVWFHPCRCCNYVPITYSH